MSSADNVAKIKPSLNRLQRDYLEAREELSLVWHADRALTDWPLHVAEPFESSAQREIDELLRERAALKLALRRRSKQFFGSRLHLRQTLVRERHR